MRSIVPGLCLLMAACTPFPDIDAANRGQGPVGPPPPLLSEDALIAAIAPGPPRAATTDDLEARAAALRARAAVLRRPATSAAALDEMRARLNRLP